MIKKKDAFKASFFFILAFKLNTSDLAADSLWKFIAEFNDSWVLVRSGVLLYIVLYLLFQLISADSSLCENDRRLNDLTSYRVGSSTYAAFENIRKFHDNGSLMT